MPAKVEFKEIDDSKESSTLSAELFRQLQIPNMFCYMNFGPFKPTDIADYCCCPVAKTPGSHPAGPGSIPKTEPN